MPSKERATSEQMAVFGLCLATFAAALNANVFAALLPFLDEALGVVSAGDKGLLLSSAALASVLSALGLGPVVDRVGRSRAILWSGGLFTLASLAHLLTASYTPLLLARAAAGLAGGVLFTSTSSAMADLVPYERRGAAMGLLTASIFLAVPVGMPLANWLAQQGHWQGIYWLQSVAAVLGVVLMLRSLPKRFGVPRQAGSVLQVLRLPMVVPALLSVALYSGAFFAAVQFAGEWLDDSGILDKQSQGLMWLVLGLATALGSVGLARFSDRMGKRRFVLVCTTGVALCFAGLTVVDSLAGLMLVGIPLTMIAAPRSAALMALLSQLVDERMRGTLMGVRAAAVYVGMGGFAWLGGQLYESQGYGTFLLVCVGALALAWLLVFACLREER